MYKVAAIVISIFALTTSAYANCEAGAYFIHTTATYHQNPMIQFLRGGNVPKNAAASYELLKSQVPSGKYKLINAPGKCDSVELNVTKGEDDYEPDIYKLSGCPDIQAETEFYYMVDVIKKTITAGKALSIRKNPNSNFSLIEKEAKLILEKTTLSSYSFDPDNTSDEKKIDRNDIINRPNYAFSHTFIGNSFVMSIAELELKNLPKYFELYDIPKEEKSRIDKEFSQMTAAFPVIYFTNDYKTNYVADGSWCSSKAVKDLISQIFLWEKGKVIPKSLGPISKFEITKAYDLNNDGEPDIITINGSVSYWLKSTNELLVIGSQYGC